jgi:hypothetical protein
LTRNNPLIQALSLVVAAVLLGLALVVGAVVLGVLLAVAAVGAIAIAARIWWLQRKIRAATAGDAAGRSTRQAIEGEYTVVDENDAKSGRPRSVGRDSGQRSPRDTTN